MSGDWDPNTTELDLNYKGLEELPEGVARLVSLQTLKLAGNEIAELPEWLGQLTQLRYLDLQGNQLTALPEWLGLLTQLRSLDLGSNQLTALPEWLGLLTQLQSLYLRSNQLTALPEWLGQLTQLQRLYLEGNQLTALPEALGQLTQLRSLDLEGNQLTALPEWLGQLTQLRYLDLRSNQLTALPEALGQLTQLQSLHLGGNPLPESLRALAAESIEALLTYLRGLSESVQVREAKVILVGEGGVGKTCLHNRLDGKGFNEDSETTRGIDVRPINVPHPKTDEPDILLNVWDFGGQEVYRTTNQFFYSKSSLYVLVWSARDGEDRGAVSDWIERIKLRVDESARIIIVATQCDERRPDLDFNALRTKHGDLLVGYHKVSSKVDDEKESGIGELRAELARLAGDLRHISTDWPKTWVNARSALLALGAKKKSVTFDEAVTVASSFEVDRKATQSLLHLTEITGHVVFHDEDELREFIVLDPEWMTKAMSYVLDDSGTEAAKGYLRHDRLAEIWTNHGDPTKVVYTRDQYPYFIKLMEHFEISYRPHDKNDLSLVAQLVPHDRPELPWEPHSELTGDKQLGMECEMDPLPPGVIPWLTVRNHRFAGDKHWRNGFLLERAWGNEALIELDGRKLSVTVRGPHPSFLFGPVRDGFEQLVQERWPKLGYKWLVPCPERVEGKLCKGRIPLQTLEDASGAGRELWPCPECLKDLSVSELLSGFTSKADPNSATASDLIALVGKIAELVKGIQKDTAESYSLSAQAAEASRHVLRAMISEGHEGPRLFTIRRTPTMSATNANYRVALWCEHPEHQHPCWTNGGYLITAPRKWLKKIAPGLRLTSRFLRGATGIAAEFAGLDVDFEHDIKPELDLADELADELLSKDPDGDHADLNYDRGRLYIPPTEALNELRALLKAKHSNRVWSPLKRVNDKHSGDILWVCPKHYQVYNPGLPVID